MAEPTIRYVWLDMNTGKFSNSWSEEDQKLLTAKSICNGKRDGWKLIRYECLTDDDFSFYNLMQIITAQR